MITTRAARADQTSLDGFAGDLTWTSSRVQPLEMPSVRYGSMAGLLRLRNTRRRLTETTSLIGLISGNRPIEPQQ